MTTESKLQWYHKICLELLWTFSLLISYMPECIRYYILKPFIAFILFAIGYRRKVIISNLSNSFPNKSAKDIRNIARNYYLFLGEVIVDTISLAGASEKRKNSIMHWKGGKEMCEKLRGKDWIAMCAHYGCWEYLLLCSREFQDAKLMGIYHPIKNIIFEHFYRRLRNVSEIVQQVPMKQAVLYFLRNRKERQGTVLGLIADQSPALHPYSHWFRFLNQDTVFNDGGEIIARKFRLPVYFAHVRRLAPGHYEFSFEEIYDGQEEVAQYEITERYCRKLEAMIKECPELWMWSHKRWKHTPEKQAMYFGQSTKEQQ